MAKQKPPAVKAAEAFQVVEHDDHNAVTYRPGTDQEKTVQKFKKDTDIQLVYNAADYMNKFIECPPAKLYKEYNKDDGLDEARKKVLTKVAEIRGIDLSVKPESKAQEFKPKAKSRGSYNSGSRQAFKHEKLTQKETDILGAAESLMSSGKTSDIPSIADMLGVTVNVVNGAISVLLAKGFCTTERARVSGTKPVRVLIPEAGWREYAFKPKADAKEG